MSTCYILGAGVIGNKAYEVIQKNCESEILYCDNDVNKWGTIVNGCRVCAFDEMKKRYFEEESFIFIASVYYQELYNQCVLNGLEVAGFFLESTGKIVSYREIVIENKKTYFNKEMIIYMNEKEKRVNKNIARFLKGDKLSGCISEVAIMLSNLCNYANIHKKCPASCINEKKIFPLREIKKIIDDLVKIDFDGTLCFHIYNEPLIDPRLFWIVDYVREKLPMGKVLLYSNGYYINSVLKQEIEDNNWADAICLTGYGENEYIRLMNLGWKIPCSVLFGHLDNRINQYESNSKAENKQGCTRFFKQISIYADGEIGLCCLDYLHPYGIGNVFDKSLIQCLDNDRVQKNIMDLLEGNRSQFSLCKNCGWNG